MGLCTNCVSMPFLVGELCSLLQLVSSSFLSSWATRATQQQLEWAFLHPFHGGKHIPCTVTSTSFEEDQVSPVLVWPVSSSWVSVMAMWPRPATTFPSSPSLLSLGSCYLRHLPHQHLPWQCPLPSYQRGRAGRAFASPGPLFHHPQNEEADLWLKSL